MNQLTKKINKSDNSVENYATIMGYKEIEHSVDYLEYNDRTEVYNCSNR